MITVQLPDGRHIDVDTTDPQAATAAARRFLASEAKAAPKPTPTPKPVHAPSSFFGDRKANMTVGQMVERDVGGRSAPKGSKSLQSNIAGVMANFNRGTGILDEGAALAGTLYDVATGKVETNGFFPGALGKDLRAAFDKRLAHQRGVEDNFSAQHPSAAALSRGIGMGASVLVPASKAVQGGNVLTQAARAGTSAAVQGAVYGLVDRGSMKERVAAADQNALIAGPLGAAVGAIAGRSARAAPKPPSRIAANVQAMERAGVRPSLVAARGAEDAPMVKAIGENWLAGGSVRKNLRRSLDDTAASAQRVAGQYGQPMTREAAGEASRAAIERHATGEAGSGRLTFRQRSGQLYDNAFSDIDAAMVGKQTPQATVAAPGVYNRGTTATVGGSQIRTDATRATLADMTGSVQSKPIADIVIDPTLKRVASALQTGGKDMTFNDLRRLRTWVREAQGNQELRQNIGSANLQRLESSLTQDIYSNVRDLGSPAMLLKLRRADQYYAAGSRQISDKLSSVFKARTNENAYDQVITAAHDEGGADLKKLTALKRAMSPEEWGDIAATAVARLGKVKPGAANAADEGAFSIASFVTNYAKLSPAGRQTLFGSRAGGGARASALKHELDNLFHVAGLQKGVEAAANNSKSGVSIQNIGSVLALLNPHTTAPTAAGLSGAALLGEAMTNPAFVRWLAKSPKAVTPVARAAHLQDLARIARANPRLAAIYTQLTGPQPVAPSASAPPT